MISPAVGWVCCRLVEGTLALFWRQPPVVPKPPMTEYSLSQSTYSPNLPHPAARLPHFPAGKIGLSFHNSDN